jgi:hypothetical protein
MVKKSASYNVLLILNIITIVVAMYLLYNCMYLKEPFENNERYTALIIEPRKHRAFEFVMNNFLINLDERWNFIVFHGTENELYVNEILTTKFQDQSERITTINLGVPNMTINEYSALMMSKDFLDKIPTEVFLVFQTDSMICPNFKDNLEKFIPYDYVGAPWTWKHPPWRTPPENPTAEDAVGNGGLSLRRKTKMLEILEKCPILKPEPEDTYFALPCSAVSIHKPSPELAKEFSMELIFSENSFGVHKSWVPWHLGETYTERINDRCEGYKTLVELNK